MDGSWDGKVLTLIEDFEYTDGVKERKTWFFTELENGEFSGVREDVVGTARGYQDGKTFRLEYTMAIPNEKRCKRGLLGLQGRQSGTDH